MPDTASTTTKPLDLSERVNRHLSLNAPEFARRWRYYRNPPAYVHGLKTTAQAEGLPKRLMPGPERSRELVIENDIAWRIHTLVDFMFGKPVEITPMGHDPKRVAMIKRFLTAVLDVNGGQGLLQDAALMGTVYGHVDLLLRMRGGGPFNLADPADAASRFVIEPIDAQRGIPIQSDRDYRILQGYILRAPLQQASASAGLVRRLRDRLGIDAASPSSQSHQHRLQVWSAHESVDYVEASDGKTYQRISAARNRLGRVPVVHIQNMPQPLNYSGLSEVEPLIVLQDELNTRLSDRANRITMQAFKMYLGRGIDQFTERPIAPGQMWHTDNPDASIQEFGGDANNPSEETHINEIRDAMDKTSGVSPVAAGVMRTKVGNLTSQNAVRLVLMGLLARVERKRVTYGTGLKQLCELILHAADVHGVLPNSPDERRVCIDWPDPIPENDREQLDVAKQKIDLGLSRQTVLNELGYGEHAQAINLSSQDSELQQDKE